jgi:DNA-binding transcriptional LysR family regulator
MGDWTVKRAGLLELNAVVAVAARHSFRAAAAELGMSPSALSHAIAGLEQRIGVRLFNRTTRSVSLSEKGARFIERVRPALGEISAAMEVAKDIADRPVGRLRINSPEEAARQIMSPIVAMFLKRFPEMEVDVVTDRRLVDVLGEGFDAGVRLREEVPRDMVAVACGPEQSFAVVGSPDYFRGRTRPATPRDLARHNCIRRRMPSGTIGRWRFEKRGAEIAVDVRGTLTVDNQDLMVEAALNGLGLAYVRDWLVAPDLAAGRLIRALDDWTPAFPGFCLYYPAYRHMAAGLRAFVGVAREVTAQRAVPRGHRLDGHPRRAGGPVNLGVLCPSVTFSRDNAEP